MVLDSPPKSYPISHFSNAATSIADVQQNGEQNGQIEEATTSPKEFFLKCGPVQDCDGSAYVEYAGAKILCKIIGPHEVTRSKDDFTSEIAARGILDVSVKLPAFLFGVPPDGDERKHRQMTEETERGYAETLSDALRPVVHLERYPKAQVDVCVTVVEQGDSLIPTAITAASAALVDAQIECFDIAIGATVSVPCSSASCRVSVGVMPSLNQMVALSHSGWLTPDQLKEGVEAANSEAKHLYRLTRAQIKADVQRKLTKEADGV